MKPLDLAISVLHLAVNATMLWVVWHWLWRRACQERLRQDLFDLRDELFDYARSGKVHFTDEAYVLLRSSINSMIRFSHLISATRIFTFICLQRYVGDTPSKQLQLMPQVALAKIKDTEVRKALEQFHSKMHTHVARHILRVSPHIVLLGPFLVFLDRALSRSQTPGCPSPLPYEEATVALIESQANKAFRAEVLKRRLEPELASV